MLNYLFILFAGRPKKPSQAKPSQAKPSLCLRLNTFIYLLKSRKTISNVVGGALPWGLGDGKSI